MIKGTLDTWHAFKDIDDIISSDMSKATECRLLGMEGGGDMEVASQIVSIFLSKKDMKPSADSRFVGARALGARRELS